MQILQVLVDLTHLFTLRSHSPRARVSLPLLRRPPWRRRQGFNRCALPQPRRARPGPWPPAPPPQPQAQPLSWAKRTGFQARVSGESTATASAPNSGQAPLPRPAEAPADLVKVQ